MWLWLSSGLVLGWSVGANVAANIFAPAVAAQMIRFATVVKLSAVFVVLGGLINGPAAMDTLSKIAGIDSLPGAWSVASASAIAIIVMTAARLPVSAAQTAVGALVGYQLFRQGSIDPAAQSLLSTIAVTWISAPLLAAATAFAIYKITAQLSRRVPMPLFLIDRWLRLGLIAVGCYGAWAFGGNNMANVASFYARLSLFAPISIGPWLVPQTEILALFGAVAICTGIATYSHRIMFTVGRDLVRLDSVTALIAILSEAAVVDFMAHSWKLGSFTLPAIPVSISQALVGAIFGLGLARGIQTIQLTTLRRIVLGWIIAPILSATLGYLFLPLALRLG
jgi:inorganic phosphate transporter, PiT family